MYWSGTWVPNEFIKRVYYKSLLKELQSNEHVVRDDDRSIFEKSS